MFFFFFNDTATTEIYTLSLHDALPIFVEPGEVTKRREVVLRNLEHPLHRLDGALDVREPILDRKSTRLNSSHANISYAVFCLKKKNKHTNYYSSHSARSEISTEK